MAHVKTNRFSGNRAVRTLGAFTLGAAMTVGGLSFASAGDVQPTPNEVQALGYNTLIFQDEFTGNELDTSKWGYEYSCFDPKTRSQAQYTDSKENASVSGGNLHLTAKYEPTRQKYDSRSHSMVTVDRECTRTVNGRSETYKAPFTSAMVQTRDNKGIKFAAYGDFYAEARIKLPNAVASWPAFWMTGIAPASFPAHGEIDVVEAKGWDPNFLQANVHTPRVGNPEKTEQHMGQLGGNGTSQTQFHTYGVEKNGNSITFYLDGKRGHTVTYDQVKGDNPFINDANGMVLRLNHMVGGSFLASERGDTTYTDAIKFKEAYQGAGSDMLVDYVRVWKKNGNATSGYSIAITNGDIPHDRSAILHQRMSEFNASIGKLVTFFTGRLTKASLYCLKRCTKGYACNFHIFSRQIGPYNLTRSIMTILLRFWPTW